LAATSCWLLYRQLDDTNYLKREKDDMARLTWGEKAVIAAALGSFLLPLAMSFVGLPPYMGLLLGLGLTWCIIELAKHYGHGTKTHLSADIDKLIQTVDISSVKYIMGILLAVLALSSIGVLAWLSQSVIGADPSVAHLINVNIGLGFLSGILDNASLVAIAINTLPMDDPQLWTLTALAAGNGGSLLVIASAAGIVAMGSYKELTIANYLRVATLPALAGLLVCFLIWTLQYYLF
jgi:Na+/H+ antiporter NhaD/arsenite permease-like protein